MKSVAKVTPASGELVQKDSNRAVLADSSVHGNSQDGLHKKSPTVTGRRPGAIYGLYQSLEGRAWTTVISALTVYALFGDDLRVAVFPMSWDIFFYTVSLVALLAFTTELVVFTIAKPNYFRSFYFWLDILATVTMISDIGFIWNPFLDFVLGGGTSGNSQEAIDAIQASRVGTKSSRIVRIVRLVRLVRVVKLYKQANRDSGEDASSENPSLVGKKLSEKTMQRVIAVVLSMLVFVQLFDVGMWTTGSPQGTFGLYRMHLHFQRFKLSETNLSTFLDNGFREEIQQYTSGIEGGRLVFFSLHGASETERDELIHVARNTEWLTENGLHVDSTDDPADYTPKTDIVLSSAELDENFRESEVETSYALECYDESLGQLNPYVTNCSSFAKFDIKAETRLAAGLNILQTIFVMIVLTFGSLMISSDAEQLVIRPIERMVRSVQQLAENPMGSANNALPVATTDDDDETVLLQNTIAKIGQLLQIGFGEAGSEIIAKNMSNNAGIEPMCDGVKMEAVFGFCDIRNFTDTTECLQEKVMVYVNRVGAIVHEATHSWYGAANKNIGDAFLLVWKMNDSKRHGLNIDVGNMCDNALVAFLKTMIDLKRENGPGGCLNAYKDHPAIRKRFGENNFEIRLGMGLHIGWAIEGAIGSHYKIDASYLSPNVNMASRLEAATKQFRTPLLLSEDFFDALSSKARKRCRKIDRVTVKGSIQPMGLFTCDIVNFPDSFGEPQYDGQRRLHFDFEGPEMDFIQAGLPQDFLAMFGDAVSAYLSGDWAACKKMLDNVLVEKPADGPTLSLLSVMEEYDFEAPSSWKGYRELTEK